MLVLHITWLFWHQKAYQKCRFRSYKYHHKCFVFYRPVSLARETVAPMFDIGKGRALKAFHFCRQLNHQWMLNSLTSDLWKKLQELELFAQDKKTLVKCHPCDTLSERQMKLDPSWVELLRLLRKILLYNIPDTQCGKFLCSLNHSICSYKLWMVTTWYSSNVAAKYLSSRQCS